MVVNETRPENILTVIQSGTISTNIFMRRMHSFALWMGWLPWPIIAYKQWPRLRFEVKRGITAQEAASLVATERDPEWRAFLELLWHIGAAQVDLASLTAEDVDWTNRTLSYHRRKNGKLAIQRIGPQAEAILKRLADRGPLFPHYSTISSADRATRFSRRCKKLGISGVSLYSYRYAWAECARVAGYPERYARKALGHSSAAVSRFYAKAARVEVPPLEEYEHHFVDGTDGVAGDARVGDDRCGALGARDGDIDPIAVEDEGKPARAVFAVTGTEGKNADGNLLPLKLVHTPDASASRERGLKRTDLGVVGCDEKDRDRKVACRPVRWLTLAR